MEAGNREPYYNLLMSGSADAWAGPSWAMEYDRVFEHTHGEVKKQFETLDDAALQALMELPTLFAYEKYIGAPARVGRLTEIMRRQREFSFTFTFDSAIAPIPHDAFMGLLHALDIDPKWEINRTHWAVKNVDLGRVLHASGLAATSLVASLRRPPKVFISYSWDSPEHRVWVAQLATSLRRDGIEAILDQWYVKLGEDLAAFMAINVRECDRVLVICTEEYVRKARERKGGVGYEQMLVTGQMMRDVGTTKFIPVVRQSSNQYMLPDELAGRLYVDLSDGPGQHDAYQHLVHELHDLRAPAPPLGMGPEGFAR
ncbi:toll/interleukin-1 receptor domain-containing protein [Burkholderia anthina]|uniref:toll/interleukin-1 receptor domain-containing protein n=2 Tax=Burkholderia anthina TaxID=179879 RepID=UPI001AA02B05|nr:toll/interleukin-1 receptor domain-containing protein [Burkholderia anthina]QTD95168.1 toll/interleukin-1 receptor domain-containing protein [Burkholderia anthina]HEP6427406.1 toll/interleukin-1 receptor domain-containing protein [Burkholderia cenocepacia]